MQAFCDLQPLAIIVGCSLRVSTLTTFSFSQVQSSASDLCSSNSFGALRDPLTFKEDFDSRSPPTHPQSHAPLQTFACCIAEPALLLVVARQRGLLGNVEWILECAENAN